jgi:hypothetical protein
MDGSRLKLLCALLLSLAACQSVPNPGSPADPAAAESRSYVDQNGMMPTMRQESPHVIESSGDYRHKGSGLVLPSSIDGFRRTDLMGYDPNDLDIGVNYKSGSEQVALTVYLFPVWLGLREPRHVSEVPDICALQFEGMMKSAESRLDSPQLVKEGPRTGDRFTPVAVSRAAIYDARSDKLSKTTEIRSEIYMSCGVDEVWIVQYRVSYRQTEDMDKVRDDFMKAVPVVQR